MIEPARVAATGTVSRVVLATSAQSGKTEMEVDLIGHRLDQRPCPILYVAPTESFVRNQFEPRLVALMDEAPTLKLKASRQKQTKTKKIIAGVPVRLAHGGSSSALKSDPAGLALVDEYDEMLANIKGQGDPLGLVEARGDTYSDFTTVVTSTPSQGVVETEVDEVSGLEFWKIAEPDQVTSPIWRLFQSGTRHHWAWPCPHCGDFFIPRFKCLTWPEKATPAQAARETQMVCPHCGTCIDHDHKTEMNAKGRYVAPGQTVTPDGEVVGEPVENSTWSYWVSGLASPFRTWGQRVEKYLTEFLTGDENKIQTAFNAQMGECYQIGAKGDMPAWEEVLEKRLPYKTGEAPLEVLRVVMAVDVQKRSLIFTTVGFGARGSSWVLDFGQLYGPTDEEAVWDELETVMFTPVGGLPIERVFVDSGFRPNKNDNGDEHKVYEFARRFPSFVFATKGHDTQTTPVKPSKIDVTVKGRKAAYSLTLMHLNTDFFKSLVHSRIRTEIGKQGAMHLPRDTTEDFARQVVSEARAVNKATGRALWVRRHKDNHFLDCLSMACAAAYLLRVHAIPEGARRSGEYDLTPPPPRNPARDSAAEPQDYSHALPADPAPPAQESRRVDQQDPRTLLRNRFGDMAGRLKGR